ncbi:MAG TPA: hypothetical protein DCM08_07870 [Microscillaceae bacterium]|jgi:hypothetical protein|nr:hypothetical protein [Microscillaceae bacterium]
MISKKLSIALCGWWLFASACTKYHQVSTPEALALEVFEALRQKDFKKIKQNIPQTPQLKLMYAQFSKQEQDKYYFEEKNLPALVTKLEQGLYKDFEGLLATAKEQYVDFKLATFLQSEYQAEIERNVEGADIKISFQYQQIKRKITFKAIKIEDNWYIIEGLEPFQWQNPYLKKGKDSKKK